MVVVSSYRCTRVEYRLVSFTQNSNKHNLSFSFTQPWRKVQKYKMSIALLTSKPQKARNMNIKPGRPPFLNIFLVQTKTSQFRHLSKDVLNSVKIQKYNVQTICLCLLQTPAPPFQFLKKGFDLSIINVKPTEIYSVVSSVYLHFPSLPVVYY